MKKHFLMTFAFLLALGLGSSVAMAQVRTTPTETPDVLATETATPSETPTPADSPDLIVAVEPEDTLDPVWVFLAGALIGAAALSLSEVSAVSYLKKHGKGPKK
jgi:hypothetical protein